jgi:hypothetical protein
MYGPWAQEFLHMEIAAWFLGIPNCTWGEKSPKPGDKIGGGRLCSSCNVLQHQLMLQVEATEQKAERELVAA